jgi:transcriptional regulator with XRE-family HTH domain
MLDLKDSSEDEMCQRLSARMCASLRALRQKRGMTLLDVAKRVGETTPQTIQRVETGKMTLTVDWIEDICRALGVDPNNLLNDRAAMLEARIKRMDDEAQVLRVRFIKFMQQLDDLFEGTRDEESGQ